MVGRKSYTLLFKSEALKKLDENGDNIMKTASELGVCCKMIRDWKSKSHLILSGEFKRENRRIGTGPKPKWPHLEKELSSWIVDERARKNCVTFSRAMKKTRELASDLRIEGKFCVGWLQKVLHRNQFSIRKATHFGQENRRSSSEQRSISCSHLTDANLLCKNIPPHLIINMD